ncbi:MAG: SDR family NAD(P)-dependent oxidoreductase [Planctomycetota bacterium]
MPLALATGWPFGPGRSLAGKRAIVTGASSGIGRELAGQLHGIGVRLLLLSRNEEKLAELGQSLGGGSEFLAGDVTDPSVRREAIERAEQAFGGLDLLFNNAGAGAYGRFIEVSPDRLRRLMEVNLFAPAEFIREAAPALAAGDDPAVVNVGSILGCRGLPFSSEYCSSKFALHGLSEAIRPELKAKGIDLLVVAPGTTETGFKQNVIDQQGTPPWARRGGVPAEHVARATLHALRRRRRFIIPNTQGWAMVTANRFAPWLVDRVLDRYG